MFWKWQVSYLYANDPCIHFLCRCTELLQYHFLTIDQSLSSAHTGYSEQKQVHNYNSSLVLVVHPFLTAIIDEEIQMSFVDHADQIWYLQ